MMSLVFILETVQHMTTVGSSVQELRHMAATTKRLLHSIVVTGRTDLVPANVLVYIFNSLGFTIRLDKWEGVANAVQAQRASSAEMGTAVSSSSTTTAMVAVELSSKFAAQRKLSFSRGNYDRMRHDSLVRVVEARGETVKDMRRELGNILRRERRHGVGGARPTASPLAGSGCGARPTAGAAR